MNEQLSDEYGASIGCVMDARKRYDDTCKTQGSESWAAQQAQEYLTRQIEHRNDLRTRYDAATGPRGKN